MTKEIAQWISNKADAANSFEVSLCDVLDVKASILLIVATFLATIATTIVTGNYELGLQAAQAIALAFLSASVVFAVAELWIKKYSVDKGPAEYIAWINATEAYWKENKPDQDISEYLLLAEAESTGRATEENHTINRKKTRFLKLAFWLLLVPLVIDFSGFAMPAYRLVMPLFLPYVSAVATAVQSAFRAVVVATAWIP